MHKSNTKESSSLVSLSLPPVLSCSSCRKSYVRNLKPGSKMDSVPSCILFASLLLLMSIGRSRCWYEFPVLVTINLSYYDLMLRLR